MPALKILLVLAPLQLGATDAVDYAREVKPLLAARCYACHGALKQEGGLRLDTAAAIRIGGESGPAVAPGKSGESLLIERVSDTDEATRMPPEGEGSPLEPRELALLKTWIDQGAAVPAGEQPEADPREHWAFHAPVRPAIPAVANADWAHNPVDTFIAARREALGLVPQPAADKRLLLRRVYLDLVGLPPTREELEAFAADESPDAYERVVARLLESPQYGERWGRHWMDVWRYSDWWGLGAQVRNSQKHIWHWRDWIVESLNQDAGYDEMLRQMLAADELYPNDLDKLRATGYLARQYFLFNRNTWLDGAVEHTAKAFLGLTLNCSKCHDHKYDPLSQEDYYRMRAFFEPYQVRTDLAPGETDFEKDGVPRAYDCHLDAPTYLFERGDEKRPVRDKPIPPGLPELLAFDTLAVEPVALPLEAHRPGLRGWVVKAHVDAAQKKVDGAQAALDKARETLAAVETKLKAKNDAGADSLETGEVEAAEKALSAARSHLAAIHARAAADRAAAQEPPPEDAGELKRAAARAEREAALAQAVADVAAAEVGLLRAEEAKKADAEKKLATARSASEKAAEALSSAGEDYTPLPGALKSFESPVETDAMRRRPFPTTSTGRRTALARWLTDRRNPLAARVAVNHIWARHFNAPLVPTVFDFGRKGLAPTHPELLDWLTMELIENGWSMKHMHRLIVTSNTYRMASTSAGSGANRELDPENRNYWRMNPTRMEAQAVRDALLHLSGDLDTMQGGPSIPVKEESKRRSLYFVHSHNDLHRFLTIFDDAGVLECYRREQSIVPQQALALSNSKLILTAAARIAERLHAQSENAADEAYIRAAFVTVLASAPNEQELRACGEALHDWKQTHASPDSDEAVRQARTKLVHAIFNHNDFITVR